MRIALYSLLNVLHHLTYVSHLYGRCSPLLQVSKVRLRDAKWPKQDQSRYC